MNFLGIAWDLLSGLQTDEANPGKVQAIAVGKNTHNEDISFTLGKNIVRCEDSVKLLGVTIDFQLNFDDHISNVCKKLHAS